MSKPQEGIFKEKGFSIIVSVDAGRWHMSVAHPVRYPMWEELKYFRYKYVPDDVTMGLLFPPLSEYVNVHPNCFHLWEIGE